MRLSNTLFLVVVVGLMSDAVSAEEQARSLDDCLAVLQKVGPKGEGHQQAILAWRQLATTPADELPQILAGMKDDNPLANNWIRSGVETIAERTQSSGGQLPIDQLEQFLQDQSHSPRSRLLTFELIVRADPEARSRLIPQMMSDPSLELRRLAVADQLTKAKAAQEQGKKDTAIAFYTASLDAARDLDQIESATEQLRELGQDVNLPDHFGFIMNWQLIGPFDNTNTSGFDVPYPPEEEVVLTASIEGKDGAVSWQSHLTEDDYGMVDINEALGKHKGAIAYAVAYFESDEERPIDLRLGCINANKIWLNGSLLTANHVYHAGRGIDQYLGKGKLKKGRNTILLKICQNEQTEDWAQDWEFQLRVCDHLGSAVLSANRPSTR